MSNNDLLLIDFILQELLLSQAITKRELARTVRVSVYKINCILANYRLVSMLREEQKGRILKLYQRLKLYELQIDDYLQPLP